jgi:acyl-CoA hydrolase
MTEVENRPAKTAADSETIVTEVVCPNDTNPMGMLQGGRLVQWMDIASAVCAQEHAGKICVTSGIHTLRFKKAAQVGDIITIKATITRAFNTSMEIRVKAWRKKVAPGSVKELINEAYFTFVALGENARPAMVPAFVPLTEEELTEFNDALVRKKTNSLHESHPA